MRKVLISLFFGFVAGVIDIIPMIIQKLDLYSCLSAFVQWIVLGVIINHVEIGLKGWLKGLIIAEAAAAPIVILVSRTDLMSVLPIMIMSAILGSFIGFVGEKYAK